MARKTKYEFYDDSFKAIAVKLGDLPGVLAKDVADALDIPPIMHYRLKKEYRDGVIMKKSNKGSVDTETANELKRLKKIEKAHKTLQMEHELLKKSIQFCSDRKRRSSNS